MSGDPNKTEQVFAFHPVIFLHIRCEILVLFVVVGVDIEDHQVFLILVRELRRVVVQIE